METRDLFSDTEVRDIFGDFRYKDKADGRISIDKKWIRRNIVSFGRFLSGRIYCHRLIKDKLVEIFSEIERNGLSQFIDMRDTVKRGGCFFPRHINWDINMPLSRHSWGMAIDVNPTTNQVATKGNIHSGIIEIFEKNGFVWGGRWQVPDPMHFECVQIL